MANVGPITTIATTIYGRSSITSRPESNQHIILDNGVIWYFGLDTAATQSSDLVGFYSTDDGATWTRDLLGSPWPTLVANAGFFPLTADKVLILVDTTEASGANWEFYIGTWNAARTALSSLSSVISVASNGPSGVTEILNDLKIAYDDETGDHIIAWCTTYYDSFNTEARAHGYIYTVDVDAAPTSWTSKANTEIYFLNGSNVITGGSVVFDTTDVGSYEMPYMSLRTSGFKDVDFLLNEDTASGRELVLVSFTESAGTWTEQTAVTFLYDATTTPSDNWGVDAIAANGKVYFAFSNGVTGGPELQLWSYTFGDLSTRAEEGAIAQGNRTHGIAVINHKDTHIYLTYSMGNDASLTAYDFCPAYIEYVIGTDTFGSEVQTIDTGSDMINMFATQGACINNTANSTWAGTSPRALMWGGHKDSSYASGEDENFLYFAFNSPPTVTMTAPTDGTNQDNETSLLLTWTYNDADSDAQTKYSIRRVADALTTEYWNGTGWVSSESASTELSGADVSYEFDPNWGDPSSVTEYTYAVKAYDGSDWGDWSTGVTIFPTTTVSTNRGFSLPRPYKKQENLNATLKSNTDYMLSWINSYVPSYGDLNDDLYLRAGVRPGGESQMRDMFPPVTGSFDLGNGTNYFNAVGATNIYRTNELSLSSERFKIFKEKQFQKALDFVLGLNVEEFEYDDPKKNADMGTRLGLVAEDVLRLQRRSGNVGFALVKDDDGIPYINDQQLVPILWQAVQELYALVEDLYPPGHAIHSVERPRGRRDPRSQ